MIRPATKQDLVRTSEIHTYGWRTAYGEFIPEDDLYTNINVARSQERLGELLSSDKGKFDIYDDGIVRGMTLHGKGRDENSSNFYEVYAIYIEPLFKSRGYGKKLLKYVEGVAKSEGFKELIIWTIKGNKQARKFYENCGYNTDGSEKYVAKWDFTEVRYIKSL